VTGNVLEIFRRLPGTNCGVCPHKTCMAFAVHLATGQADVGNCPLLSDASRTALLPLLRNAGDWREHLADELAAQLPGRAPSDYPSALGLRTASPTGIAIPYLGQEVILDEEGFLQRLSPWDRILILRYLVQRGSEAPRGDWISFRELRGGLVKASAFADECERPLGQLLGRDVRGCAEELESLGARRLAMEAGARVWEMNPLPAIPVRIFFRPPEEGFEADCRILFDPSATAFLDVESLIFLGERIIDRLGECDDSS